MFRHSSLAVLLAAAPLAAQHCVGGPPPATLRTNDPFTATFFLSGPCWPPCPMPPTYTGVGLLFDLVVDAPLSITGLATQVYDEGTPGTNPDQTGNLGIARFYVCPTSWVGSHATRPSAPGSPWTLAATGVYTVGRYPAVTPIALQAAFALPAGTYGVLLELAATDTVFHAGNQNVGAVHPLLHVQPAAERHDQFLRVGNHVGQTSAFESAVTPLGINVAIDYVPDPNAAWWQTSGPGCYAAPPSLGAATRPQFGTLLQLVTGDLPAGASAVITALGFQELPGGLALAPYGLPGCSLFVGSFDWLFVLAAGPGPVTASLPLPATTALARLPLHAQSAVAMPGANPAGLLLSNSICLVLR